MNARELKECMRKYLITNFGTSDEPSYASLKNLRQLVYEIEQEVENGEITEPI